MKKLTTDEFISRAKTIHGERYDYSKVEYKGCKTRVCIICPEHGEFWQTPEKHLMGRGCSKCKGRNRNTKEFIESSKSIHGDIYEYSNVRYINATTKVCIKCPVHGDFWQTPHAHLAGHGCPKCKLQNVNRFKKYTSSYFITRAKKIHGDKYNYIKVEYKNNATEVCIICPKHGEFWQRPKDHLNGRGCPKCCGKIIYNTELFIEKAKQVHNNKYDYALSKYKGYHTKTKILCPVHGEFEQTPASHLRGNGCRKCATEKSVGKKRLSLDKFILKAIQVHGYKYDYSSVILRNMATKIDIRCHKHGIFTQIPSAHLQGQGCPKCAIDSNATKRKLSYNDFVERAIIIHNNRYIYLEFTPTNVHEEIDIVCPKHGIFKQKITNHLIGHGCPHCNESHGEREISKWLDSYNIRYERQYKVIPTQVLFGRNLFKVDFYLPDHNTFIEFHGEQHYKRAHCWHTEEQFAEQQDRDHRLREHCKQNKIRLIEIPYTDIDNIDKILTRKILKYKKK